MKIFTAVKVFVVAQTAIRITSVAGHPKSLELYDHARTFGFLDKYNKTIGKSIVKAPNSDAVVKMRMKVDNNGKIIEARLSSFGKTSTIVSTSLITTLMKGKTVDEGLAITNSAITEHYSNLRLPPEIPTAKIAEDAIRKALIDYKEKQKSYLRINQ